MGLHLKEGADDDLAENHEINVTPFIDVMLVLLIIFMVAAPLATVDIKVDLPASTAKPAPRPEKPVFLSVKADQRLYIGDDEVKADTLGAALDAKTKGKKDTTIFFQADKGVDYGDLMSVMDKLRSAGYLKVGLVGLETAAKK
ncbi:MULTISPECIES: TonB system transport protein ExbD [Pseudomonas]|jgi:biopolymer transport protein ExbD|uniref:Biopolymer transport protein ExbD n=1 Tax=Pseudomonas monsensis TaxID=2745509 RepID=A0ABT3YQD6_9PSED|nr:MULTISPECIES: TonB system transport protein ExbD [Pseudomonas]PTT93567.1 TonB system transport protein ExbD [Pseudomonas sp. HMWF005]RON60403.1 TonB system transport protein ExbD [Pseudomonas fluorescens]MCY0107710.1 TonB system transport protein ExbD [Pseudomonas monsensis]MDZ3827725.1 TonB system transport protein ExbD [Pseudomonas monsensis]PTS97194.1 TonB system transport protein ExbD [Pseudomonas sp. HMWF006]